MKQKILTCCIIITFLFTIMPITISEIEETYNHTIYVDDDNTIGPWDGSQEHPYQHLQEAIDHSIDGDTVFVYNGYYSETNITCNKSIYIIGEEKENTIIDGYSPYTIDSIFKLNESEILITNFTFKNYLILFSDYYLGKPIENGDTISIKNNIIKDTISGFVIAYSSNTLKLEIKNNIISTEDIDNLGNIIQSPSESFILSNNIIDGFHVGIYCFENAEINQNQFSHCYIGIYAYISNNKIPITNNNFIENKIHSTFTHPYNFISWNNTLAHFPHLSSYIQIFSDNQISNTGLKGTLNSVNWNNNYWDNKKGIGPKCIIGDLSLSFLNWDENDFHIRFFHIPWIKLDRNPAKEPYEIDL